MCSCSLFFFVAAAHFHFGGRLHFSLFIFLISSKVTSFLIAHFCTFTLLFSVISVFQLVRIYSRTSTNGHYFCPSPQSIHWLLFKLGKPPLKRVSNCQNNLSTTASFFSDWWKHQEWSWNLILMAFGWLIAAIIFWLCFIYTAAVSINCLQYL